MTVRCTGKMKPNICVWRLIVIPSLERPYSPHLEFFKVTERDIRGKLELKEVVINFAWELTKQIRHYLDWTTVHQSCHPQNTIAFYAPETSKTKGGAITSSKYKAFETVVDKHSNTVYCRPREDLWSLQLWQDLMENWSLM